MDEIADTFDTPLRGVSDIAGHTLLNVTSMPRSGCRKPVGRTLRPRAPDLSTNFSCNPGGSGCPRRSHGVHRSRPSRYRCRTSRHAVSGHHPSYAQLLRLRSRGEQIAGLSALRWLEEEGARPSPSAPTTTHRSVGSLSFQINDDSRLTENRCRRSLKAGLSELEQLCD